MGRSGQTPLEVSLEQINRQGQLNIVALFSYLFLGQCRAVKEGRVHSHPQASTGMVSRYQHFCRAPIVRELKLISQSCYCTQERSINLNVVTGFPSQVVEIAKRRKCLATPGLAEREGEGEERATTAASKKRNILFHQKGRFMLRSYFFTQVWGTKE